MDTFYLQQFQTRYFKIEFSTLNQTLNYDDASGRQRACFKSADTGELHNVLIQLTGKISVSFIHALRRAIVMQWAGEATRITRQTIAPQLDSALANISEYNSHWCAVKK